MAETQVTARRRYRFSRSVDRNFLATADKIAQLAPAGNYVSCSARLEAEPDLTYEFSTTKEWRTFIQSRWTSIVRADLHWAYTDGFVTLEGDVYKGWVEISVQASSAAEVHRRLADLEGALGCAQLPDANDQAVRGVRRHYFVNSPITPVWIDELASVTQHDLGIMPSVDARVRLANDKSTEHIFRDLTAWRSEVLASWPKVASVYLWLWEEGRKISFNCDVPRQLLRVETEASSYDEAVLLMSSLEKKLDLEEAPEDPYQYRRFARFFEIRKWKTNAAFADAVKAARARAFTGGVAFVSGFVTRGGSEQDLEPILSFEAFIKEVGDAGSEYDGAELYLEGPRGKALGIELDRTKRTLKIRSSLDRKEFNAVAEEFENAIDVRLTKDVSPTESPSSRTSSSNDLLAKLVLAVLGLFFSVEFIKEAIPRDTLEITFPRPGADSAAVINANVLRPQWMVHRERWWDKRDLETLPSATVRLLDAEGNLYFEQGDEYPGLAIPVQEGEYELIVTLPELRESSRLRVKLVRPGAATAESPATID